MVTKMSLQENFETYLKDNYRNRKHVGNTEDISDFPLDFFQFLEERRRQLKKNEQDETIWSQELDYFIADEKKRQNKRLIKLVRNVKYGISFFPFDLWPMREP